MDNPTSPRSDHVMLEDAADADDIDQLDVNNDDSGTPLDKTIDKIGMGSYQWALLTLCGFGWAADNMWLQAIAIILPRVRDQYGVSNNMIGALSSSTFAGMFLGAFVWGTCSDVLGRAMAFNLTLILTSLIGFTATLAQSYIQLCVVMFFLGTAVGGSMPTDQTLALETLPRSNRHLLTSLSIFFSFGSVVAAVAAILIIPSRSCIPPSATQSTLLNNLLECDVRKDNNGWKVLLFVLATITLVMFVCRIVLFRLYESPRWLVHAGRKEDAVEALSQITKYNRQEFDLTIEDVHDEGEIETTLRRETTATRHSMERPLLPNPATQGGAPNSTPILSQYLNSHHRHLRSHSRTHRSTSAYSRYSTYSTHGNYSHIPHKMLTYLPRWLRRPLGHWLNRFERLITEEWRERVWLIWGVWCTMSLAYTMFNVYLPTLLEARTQSAGVDGGGGSGDGVGAVEGNYVDALWEIVLYALGGCPGALLGAYLIDTKAQRVPLSKTLTLAMVTLSTALCCFAFVMVDGTFAIMVSTIGVSLTSTAMWAILYGMTPELFATEVRGTACGSASALSRIGGITAPLIGGPLVALSPTLTVITSVAMFLLSAILLFFLDRALVRAAPTAETDTGGEGTLRPYTPIRVEDE